MWLLVYSKCEPTYLPMCMPWLPQGGRSIAKRLQGRVQIISERRFILPNSNIFRPTKADKCPEAQECMQWQGHFMIISLDLPHNIMNHFPAIRGFVHWDEKKFSVCRAWSNLEKGVLPLALVTWTQSKTISCIPGNFRMRTNKRHPQGDLGASLFSWPVFCKN